MVCHVGYNGTTGVVNVYNKYKVDVNSFQVPQIPIANAFQIKSIFRGILDELKGNKFGCFCISVYKCKNRVRKMLIEYGLEIGFKEVLIIDKWTSMYSSLALQTECKPKNGDVIWIVNYSTCYIWEKERGCAKYVHYFDFSEQTNLDKLFSETKWKPNAIFVESCASEFDSKKAKEMFSSCFIDSFSGKSDEYSAMIKARITANDPAVTEWDAQAVLDFDISIKQGDETLLKIEECQSLPLKETFKLKNPIDPVDVIYAFKEKYKIPPKNEYCRIKIDKNGIFSTTFAIAVKNTDANIFNGASSSAGLFRNDPSIRDKRSMALTPKFQFPLKMSMNNDQIEAIGIDLGTSRCCAAVNRRNGIETVALENAGERLLPSYVAYDEKHDKCGQVVINRLKQNHKSTVFDVKRLIGKRMDEIVIDSIWPFSITNLNDKVSIQIVKVYKESTMLPEEISASLLKHIKDKCEKFQEKSLTTAVITIPAVFTESQKEATLKAANLAGWKTVELLPEPIAASFAYFIDRPFSNQSIVLVFDLGGGTLDVCISNIEKNSIQIIAQNGDSQLGGRDFDKILINYVKNLLVTDFGISMSKNKYRLMLECQNLKETLSSVSVASLHVDDFDPTKVGLLVISRAKFEKMSEILLEKIRNTILTALSRANIKSSQINKVLQVGGGSRMPMVKNLLNDLFPTSEHCCDTNPDEVVAIGAAYYAYTRFSS